MLVFRKLERGWLRYVSSFLATVLILRHQRNHPSLKLGNALDDVVRTNYVVLKSLNRLGLPSKSCGEAASLDR